MLRCSRLERASWSLAVALCALASLGVARAQRVPDALRVAWSAPLDCPRTRDFDSELARLLGPGAHAYPPSEARVEVSALQDGSARYRLRLQLTAEGQDSERTLELASCSDVRHAAALLIATALGQAEDDETALQPSAAKASSAWELRVALAGDLQSLPEPTLGPQLGAAWSTGRWRVTLDARYLLAREARDDTSQLRADIGLLAAGLGVAQLWQLGKLGLGPSLSAELGVLRARGAGELARNASTAWLSAQLGAVADIALGEHIGLIAAAELCVPLLKPTYSLDNEPPFYETPDIGARALLGMRVRFESTKAVGSGQ